MTRISKIFTYDIEDDYLAQTNELGKTGTWTYNGPDRIWTFVDMTTRKSHDSMFFTLEEDGPNIPTPVGCTKLEIDCSVNPLFCTLVGASDHVDGNTLPRYTEELPNGETYSRPLAPMPDHTYEFANATYNVDTKEWHYPWKETWVTWDDLRPVIAKQLADVTLELSRLTTLPANLRTQLEAYKLELENFETTWAGYAAYKVWIPRHPINK